MLEPLMDTGKHAYAERNFGLFIESDHNQAKLIAEATGKRVLCTGTRKVY